MTFPFTFLETPRIRLPLKRQHKSINQERISEIICKAIIFNVETYISSFCLTISLELLILNFTAIYETRRNIQGQSCPVQDRLPEDCE